MMANKMQEIRIEKVVLSIGGTADKLEKGVKLLNRISEEKTSKIKSAKRIPSFGVRPGLEVGCMVTLRGGKAIELLKRLLSSINNTLRKKQISENSFTFGIKEYIEIPGMQYQRDIGIIGLDVTVSFYRAGKRVKIKKIKRGKVPKRQNVSKEEIIKFMEANFNTNFK
ncbi:50S ribosomal protein L5 [archaeon]|nr:50S ribosomal protein L5 [archaeon]